MNWYEWLGFHTNDLENCDDHLELMKKAYVAGLQTAYDIMYLNEDGDYDFIMWRLKNLIGESE